MEKWVVWNIFSGLYGADIDKSTICQCIGLKDKNGKLIWENDILVGYLDDNYPQNATYEMVLWNKSGFCTKEQGSNDILEFCEFDQKYFEVCGNIFDNPELFESEDNMTESEAIKELQENIDLPFGSNVSKEAAKMAIQALEKQEKIKENMTESKAKTILETEIVHHPECSVFSEALSIAIQTLEKQIPYKPREYEDKYYSCKCGNVLLYKWKKYPRELTDKKMGLPYCLNCGQKLDWSDEE